MTSTMDELYGEYAVGMVLFLARLLGRVFLVGIHALRWDDVLTVVALVFWTVDLVLLNRIGITGSSVGQTTESVKLLDDATVESYKLGDKLTVASWFSYICLIWSMKGVVLFFYNRMTLNLLQNKVAIWVSWGTLLTFLVAVLFQFTLCVPFEDAWQVRPYPGDKCVYRKENYILYPILSIISDIGIMAIAMPLLWQAKLSLFRRIMLGIFFLSGIFIIIATLLRTVYSLRSLSDLEIATRWASREYLVTAFVVSAPAIKPLFSRRLWGLRGSTNKSGSNGYSGYGNGASHPSALNQWRSHDARITLRSVESQEHIIKHKGGDESPSGGIHVTETFTVASQERQDV